MSIFLLWPSPNFPISSAHHAGPTNLGSIRKFRHQFAEGESRSREGWGRRLGCVLAPTAVLVFGKWMQIKISV